MIIMLHSYGDWASDLEDILDYIDMKGIPFVNVTEALANMKYL